MHYLHFEFKTGANPYISTSIKNTTNLIFAYDMEQKGDLTFLVDDTRNNVAKTYSEKKEKIRNFASEWQYNFNNHDYSLCEIGIFNNLFEILGKKYGLLKEFRENAII